YGSRLYPLEPVPSMKNLYGAPSPMPGTKPVQYPRPSLTSRLDSSCVHALKSPLTYTVIAEGAQTRNVTPSPGMMLPPMGVCSVTLSWDAGMIGAPLPLQEPTPSLGLTLTERGSSGRSSHRRRA